MIQKSFAEFIGTFAMVFFGCGSIMLNGIFPDLVPQSAVPVVFGSIVATMIYTVGHISGAHFNPAVTLAFAIMRHFPAKQVPFYWLAQFAGAIAAIAILSILIPESKIFGATIPKVNVATAFAWEMTLSFFLMFVIIAVATDTRAVGVMAGMAIGTIVGLCAYTGGNFTGASMNPARSLAPALFEGMLENIWIYFLAPASGAILGAVFYQRIRCESPVSKAGGCC